MGARRARAGGCHGPCLRFTTSLLCTLLACLPRPLSSRLLPPLLNRKSTERPPPPTYFGRDLGDWARPSLFLLVFLFFLFFFSLPTSFYSAACGVMRVHYPVRVRVRTSAVLTGQRGEMAPLSLPLARRLGRALHRLPQLCL